GHAAHGHEVVVLLPHHERALGAQHVLLPPDLPQIVARDAAPRRARRLDLAELEGAVVVTDAVGRREVRPLPVGVEQRGVAAHARMMPGDPASDLGLAGTTVLRVRVAAEPRAEQLLEGNRTHGLLAREACDIRGRDAARTLA